MLIVCFERQTRGDTFDLSNKSVMNIN